MLAKAREGHFWASMLTVSDSELLLCMQVQVMASSLSLMPRQRSGDQNASVVFMQTLPLIVGEVGLLGYNLFKT